MDTGEGAAEALGDVEDLVTLEELTLAISKTTGLEAAAASRDAEFIMDVFGFDDRVIDNVLEREDRQLFYLLEEEGLLSTEREMTTLYDDRDWMTHYWILRKDVIKHASREEHRDRARRRGASEEEVLYRSLPEEAWHSGAFSA